MRHWICSECGAEHDRDINAALNILAAGGIPVSMEESSPFRASEDVNGANIAPCPCCCPDRCTARTCKHY
ncbi:zinc ribbon domain-containing protein [Thiolapillus sp.]|uniref:zinc ribbon domain-containing protein n=1 Tax=Thiolapillus sp. TaxID=2017437 RepID=UPI003AF47DED